VILYNLASHINVRSHRLFLYHLQLQITDFMIFGNLGCASKLKMENLGPVLHLMNGNYKSLHDNQAYRISLGTLRNAAQ